jgi:uncharacterized protein HemY
MLCYLFNNLGDLAFNRGTLAQATTYCQEGEKLARQLQQPFSITALLIMRGKCLTVQHEYIEAQQVLQEAVALARQSKLAEKLCVALCYLGKAIGYVEGYDRARDCFQESLALAQQLSTPETLSKVLTAWGEIELFHGHVKAARAFSGRPRQRG